jgi:hypothetical protein
MDINVHYFLSVVNLSTRQSQSLIEIAKNCDDKNTSYYTDSQTNLTCRIALLEKRINAMWTVES